MMARTRLVDPMATVEAVSRDALGVATQAEADAAAGTLERYRDTDEARREAPVVAGSTADGTALNSVIAALRNRGMVVDASETVDDEVVTGSLVTDTLQVQGDITFTDTNAATTRYLAVASSTDDANGTFLAISSGSGTGTNKTAGGLVLRGGQQTGNAAGSRISLQTATQSASSGTTRRSYADRVAVDSNAVAVSVPLQVTGNSTVTGTLDVTGTTTLASALTAATNTVTIGSGTTVMTTLKTAGKANTAAAGVAAGTSPSVDFVAPVSGVTSNGPVAGHLHVKTGTSPTTGALVTVTFGDATLRVAGRYQVFLQALDSGFNGLNPYIGQRTDSTFTVSVGTAPAASTDYRFSYFVIDVA